MPETNFVTYTMIIITIAVLNSCFFSYEIVNGTLLNSNHFYIDGFWSYRSNPCIVYQSNSSEYGLTSINDLPDIISKPRIVNAFHNKVGSRLKIEMKNAIEELSKGI